jgi:hypothetical protein
MTKILKLGLLGLMFATVGLLVGCKTTAESQNFSERPWNAPAPGFGTGLPMDINRGR